MRYPNKLASFRSPIFWRITASVFASILLIEIVLLVYSWVTERNRVVARLDDALVTVGSLLDTDNPIPQLDKLLNVNSEDSKYTVIGYVYESSSGARSVGGVVADANEQIEAESSRFDGAQAQYTHFRNRALSDGSSDKLWLVVDAAWINAYMQSYVWRILGMILLISLFVTGACLVFLNPLLISPLRRINHALEQGERYGIRKIRRISRDFNRSDEIGNINRSLGRLQQALVNAENEKLRASERFEVFANLGADCFWELDRNFKFTYFSGDTARMFDLAPESIVGRSYKELINNLADRAPNAVNIYESLRRNGNWEGKIKSSDDRKKEISIRVAASLEKNAHGLVIGVRGTINDISAEMKLANELEFQANHDELTGLANRRQLTREIDLCMTQYINEGQLFTLVIMDLDRFKYVNDTGGHPAGDALLKALATKFKSHVRAMDIVARMGGDEFALLLRSCDIESAKRIAEKIRATIEAYRFTWNKEVFSVSISIGLAQASQSLRNKEALIFAADSCCLKAKQQGKNQIQAFSHEDTSFDIFKDEAKWVSRINHAVEHNRFALFHQSIICINDPDKEEHFEILLRMKDDEGGFYPPNIFLPVAERNKLMPIIDKWVVTNAMTWLEDRKLSADTKLCMNINLSAASLADVGFRDFIVKFVAEHKSLAKFICFEITETAAMVNFDQTIALLNDLKSSGCSIALDDFGTGFSSLSHIQDLPLDYIKIDGRFIQEIIDNKVDQAVVQSVSNIAKVLQIKTVAEFVDSEDKLQMLDELQIDYAQGFLFSKPQKLPDSSSDDMSDAA